MAELISEAGGLIECGDDPLKGHKKMLETLKGDEERVSKPKRAKSVPKLVGSIAVAVNTPVPDEGPKGPASGSGGCHV